MVLKPQDVLVLLKLSLSSERRSRSELGCDLAMSASEVHHAINRLARAQLVMKDESWLRVAGYAACEFLVHGVRYAFPPERGGVTQGMPTSSAAPPLDKLFMGGDALPPVWPDPEGWVRGLEFSPLYRSVPRAARNDDALYELLALVDAMRGGRARERNLAEEELERRLIRSAG